MHYISCCAVGYAMNVKVWNWFITHFKYISLSAWQDFFFCKFIYSVHYINFLMKEKINIQLKTDILFDFNCTSCDNMIYKLN